MSLEHDTALEEQDQDEARLAEVHSRAMKRFDDCAYESQELRSASLAARRFISIPGAQWDGEWGEQFANAIKIESDKLRKVMRKIETDYRENRIVPDFRPDGPGADNQTAETLDGMHRADSYRFKSQQARDNAVFEAVSGGFGAYRLSNEWDDESDPQNDYQRINPASIIVDADQCVYFDKNSKLYDKSDARFGFIRVGLSPDAHEEAYPDAGPTEFPSGTIWRMRDWFVVDQIAVAEYYEVEKVREYLHILTYPVSGEEQRIWASDLEDGQLEQMQADGWASKRQRRTRKRVHKYVMNGAEILEDLGYIAGDSIPIVPVYGKRYFVEGMERWEGCVQPKMDDQRLHNSMLGKLAEMNSLSPREVPIFAPEQMVGDMPNLWARANIDRKPYLLAEPLRNESGEVVAQGPLAYVKPPDMPPALAAIISYTADSLNEEAMDGADQVKANTSAEAMDIAATRVDAKSGIYLDNIAQSTQREGEIYFGMAREVYCEKDRRVETMTEDGDDGEAVLMASYTDPETGKNKTINDLSGARYKVIVSVTEATATRRDKTVRSLMNVAQVAMAGQDAELAQAALYTAVMNTDGEGSEEFIAWVRQKSLGIGLVKPSEEEQQAMQAAAENQQPDPTQQLVEAETARTLADAEKTQAETEETRADTFKKTEEAMLTRLERIMTAGQTVQ